MGCLWCPLLGSHRRQADVDLRQLLQAFALGAVLTLQPLKVSAHLSQLQLQLGVTAVDKGEGGGEEEGGGGVSGVVGGETQANKWTKRVRGGRVLGELINHPLLLVDLIPQAGQLLVVQAAVRLPLLARSPLQEKSLNMRTT